MEEYFGKLVTFSVRVKYPVQQIQLGPKFAFAHNNRSRVYYKLDDHSATLAVYYRVIHPDRECALYYTNREILWPFAPGCRFS